MPPTSPCSICGTPVHAWERYPNLVCNRCVGLARDEEGRPMRFGNETMLGSGFVAEVQVDGAWRRVDDAEIDATCWIGGKRCVAGEHRFGGVVVQALD